MPSIHFRQQTPSDVRTFINNMCARIVVAVIGARRESIVNYFRSALNQRIYYALCKRLCTILSNRNAISRYFHSPLNITCHQLSRYRCKFRMCYTRM